MNTLEELNDEQFETARAFIYRSTGISLSKEKRTLLSNRLRRRMRSLGHEDLGSYLAFVTSERGRGELPEFINAVTTNETFFFRNPEQYDWFRKDFIHETTILGRRGLREKRLRVWSAACSTGAEPYSIAICLLENQLKLKDWEVEVVATDISGEVLQQAREGLFKQRSLELVNPDQLRRYFTKQADGATWKVKPNVSDVVRFERHNLMQPLHAEPFDCIFLKNVLIYFDTDSKGTVVGNLSRRLVAGGYLVLGPSEGVYDMLDPLKKRRPWLFHNEE